ncbi:hypothetical protein ACWJPR_27100, partial [Klebsiella pneumoniae]
RITPSVAEQEGQQTETEATGAPQKHHYTLNQQVGSITGSTSKTFYADASQKDRSKLLQRRGDF